MHGNVVEWTADVYFEQYARQAADSSAPSSPRAVRGGSWFLDAGDCRSATRDYLHPAGCTPDIGFRVARDLPEDL
jgi:formylglycine-generating enzyme required for sulfatase activity